MNQKRCIILFVILILGLSTHSVCRTTTSHEPTRRLLRSHHHHHHHGRHHHNNNHHHHASPPTPTPKPPSPQPPPPHNGGHQSLTELITGLKKSHQKNSANTNSERRNLLSLPGLKGEGIVVSDAVIVSKTGAADFITIGEAINSAPDKIAHADGRFVIYAEAGVYEEYISISSHKQNILLLGDGIGATIITGNHSSAGGWGTSGSATFTVAGDRFMAIDVTFRNSYGQGSQAVAVLNEADMSAFYRCSFEGYQDTLYAHSMNQFYRDCDIYGNVDFIFGDAAAVFQNCRILARGGAEVTITAQGREDPHSNTGFAFHNSTIDATPEFHSSPHGQRHHNSRSNRDYLGRPWKLYSRAVFMQCYIGDFINLAGWIEWDGRTNGLDKLYYGEYQNHGPGSDTSHRVDWPGFKSAMSDSDAISFTVQNFLDGNSWLPSTCIPFSSRLL